MDIDRLRICPLLTPTYPPPPTLLPPQPQFDVQTYLSEYYGVASPPPVSAPPSSSRSLEVAPSNSPNPGFVSTASTPGPFQTVTKGWEIVPVVAGPKPKTRRSHGATLYEPTDGSSPSLIISFGFYSDMAEELGPLSDVWGFDLHASVWSKLYDGTSAMERGGHLTVAHEDKLFSFGGLM